MRHTFRPLDPHPVHRLAPEQPPDIEVLLQIWTFDCNLPWPSWSTPAAASTAARQPRAALIWPCARPNSVSAGRQIIVSDTFFSRDLPQISRDSANVYWNVLECSKFHFRTEVRSNPNNVPKFVFKIGVSSAYNLRKASKTCMRRLRLCPFLSPN